MIAVGAGAGAGALGSLGLASWRTWKQAVHDVLTESGVPFNEIAAAAIAGSIAVVVHNDLANKVSNTASPVTLATLDTLSAALCGEFLVFPRAVYHAISTIVTQPKHTFTALSDFNSVLLKTVPVFAPIGAVAVLAANVAGIWTHQHTA